MAGGVGNDEPRAVGDRASRTKAFARGDRTVQDTTLGWRFRTPRCGALFPLESMGETGENVAERYGDVARGAGRFALESQERAGRRRQSGDSLTSWCRSSGRERDEHPRPDTTAASARLAQPVFRDRRTVTAGNSSGVNDGAAALARAAPGWARARRGAAGPLRRLGRRGRRSARDGDRPDSRGAQALARAGCAVEEVDLVELNEAFARRASPCIRELGIDPARVNVNGGAIAIGHPLGMSGARLVVPLLQELPAAARTSASRRCASASGRDRRRCSRADPGRPVALKEGARRCR